MKRTRIAAVVIIAALLALVCIRQIRIQTAVADRIPSDLKQRITDESRFIQDGQEIHPGVVWRAFRAVGETLYVVAEWQVAPLYGTVPYTKLTFYRIIPGSAGSRIPSWTLHWQGATFEGECSYSLVIADDPKQQRPYEHFAVGTALDKKIARVIALTQDGRETAAVLFDGYWWMTATMDPANYVRDKWVEIQALDASGNILYSAEPQYPRIPCEPPPSDPTPG
ncbi:MAG: hypothetical protein ACM3XN_07475 [Chloroflexota bacterium]